MSDTKIFQMILDGQASLKKDMKSGFDNVNKRIIDIEKNLISKIKNIKRDNCFRWGGQILDFS